MRHERGLKAGEPNNFDFFTSESLITQFRKLTAKIKLAAFIIGTIALIVAGIGIMNIMLVSVTERTKESASASRWGPIRVTFSCSSCSRP
jgi:putative ABC transport system permease protein